MLSLHKPALDVALLKARLEEWAEWYSQGEGCGLGYTSPTGMYAAWVPLQGAPTALYVSSHPEAEEMEAWIKELAQMYPLRARALRAHYLYAGSLRAQARALAISHVHVKRVVEEAHAWLLRRWHREIVSH